MAHSFTVSYNYSAMTRLFRTKNVMEQIPQQNGADMAVKTPNVVRQSVTTSWDTCAFRDRYWSQPVAGSLMVLTRPYLLVGGVDGILGLALLFVGAVKRWRSLRSSYTTRTKCAISDAFVRDCVFADCSSVAQYVYSLSAEHCFRLRNTAISDERVRYCALCTRSVAWPLVAERKPPAG